MSTTETFDKPDLDDDLLAHYGVKGMKWGVRRGNLEGVSGRTNREARKDADEFARAKMFYGEGAGNRRKLIKAKVEAKGKRDPNYQKAFDHHLGRQNMAKHAEKARGERKRKDAGAAVRKTGNSINRAINGPFAGSAAVALITAGAMAARNSGLDRKATDAFNQMRNNQKLRKDVTDFLKNAANTR